VLEVGIRDLGRAMALKVQVCHLSPVHDGMGTAIENNCLRSGMVAQACNLSTWDVEAGGL
jgi:hypothetical protein